MALNDLLVRSAKAREKPYKLWDSNGLFMLVALTGSRLWRLRYTFAGKERVMSLGKYPRITLAQAREKRNAARSLLDSGIDPAAQKPAEVPVLFEPLAREWHALLKDQRHNVYWRTILNRLERDIFPAIGSRPINEIEPKEIIALVRAVEDRGAMDVSKRIRGYCRDVFDFHTANGGPDRNPAANIGKALKPAPRVQHQKRLTMAEMPAFLADLSRYTGHPQTRLAIKFAILNWVRTSEIRFLTWPEFEGLDTERPLWRIPGERMKMRREHIVPLSRQALYVVHDLWDKRTSDTVVFHGDPNQPTAKFMSENTMLYALYSLGLHRRATMHGFRSTASTWANECLREDGARKYDKDWIETQLAHVEGNAVREAYNAAQYLEPRARLLQDWADRIDADEAMGLMLG